MGIAVVRRVNHSVKRTEAIRGVEASNLSTLLRSRLRSDSASLVLPQLTVTNIMLATNVFSFIAATAIPGLQHAIMKIDHRIIRGESYRLLSSLFAHGGLSHLAMNCLSLRNVGPQVQDVSFYYLPTPPVYKHKDILLIGQAERIYGPAKFLGIYLGSGVAANAVTTLLGSAP
jgi:membrane associated rhomboid family serine protease